MDTDVDSSTLVAAFGARKRSAIAYEAGQLTSDGAEGSSNSIWTLRSDASNVMMRVERIAFAVRTSSAYHYGTVWRQAGLLDVIGFNPGYVGADTALVLDDWTHTFEALLGRVSRGERGSYELSVMCQAIVDEALVSCLALKQDAAICECPRCKVVQALMDRAQGIGASGHLNPFWTAGCSLSCLAVALARRIDTCGVFVTEGGRILVKNLRSLYEGASARSRAQRLAELEHINLR